MTTTQQGQPEAVSADGAVADEVPPRYHARDSGTTCSYADLIIQISEQSSVAKSAGTRWEQVVVSFLSTDPPYRAAVLPALSPSPTGLPETPSEAPAKTEA